MLNAFDVDTSLIQAGDVVASIDGKPDVVVNRNGSTLAFHGFGELECDLVVTHWVKTQG